MARPDLPEFSEADRDFCQRVKEMWEGVDRVGLTIESCHRRNMQCFAWLRIQNEGEHIHGRFPISRFYLEHLHLREKNINGDPVPGKLCLAYDQVRQFHLALVTEAMRKGADGVMIDTMRHLPKVMYGDPVVAAFKAEHGIDMRSLPPFDPRVMRAQIDVMTAFLREVRAAMRAVKPDAELHVRVCKPHPLMGCDPGAWARQGVVDVVLIEDRVGARRPDLPGMIDAAGNAAATAYSFTRPHWGREKGPLHPARVAEEAAWTRRLGAPMIAFYESADIIDRPDLTRAIRALNG